MELEFLDTFMVFGQVSFCIVFCECDKIFDKSQKNLMSEKMEGVTVCSCFTK